MIDVEIDCIEIEIERESIVRKTQTTGNNEILEVKKD